MEIKFYKFFKLSNGEDIIASTDTNCEDFKNKKSVLVYDPVQISSIRLAQGSYYVQTYTMQPWIKLAKDDTIEIPTESIVVAVDVEDNVITQYENFLYEYSNSSPEFNSISEDELDEFLEPFESEDDFDERRDTEEGPTFH